MAHVPLPPAADRWVTAEATLTWRPGPVPYFGNVSALRADADALPGLVERARAWFAERGREDFVWFLGPSTRPADAAERLVALGAEPFGGGTAMVLDHEPPPAPGHDIRPVSTPDELLAFRLLMLEAGGQEATDEVVWQVAAGNNEAWLELDQMGGTRQLSLLWLDGRPVAGGGLQLTDDGVAILAGGGTMPEARGRGCYRALVHARWVAARATGGTHLAVQASDQSAPILAGLGFRAVAPLVTLVHRC